VPWDAQDVDEGVRRRRRPSRSWAGPSTGRDEKAPLGGLSAATSRPPLRAIQPCPSPTPSSLKPQLQVPTPNRSPGAPVAADKAPMRRSAPPPLRR
jgi:hypothetical protein